MNRMSLLAAVAAAAIVPGISTAAQAQTSAATPAATATASVTAGATVYDTSGGVVGTVASVDGANAVIDTGAVKAAVPISSLGAGAKGPVLAMTRAQLDAAASQQQAAASADFKARLTPGASVYGTGGVQLGTIKAVDASYVTLTTAAGDAKLPIGGFGPGPQGVTLGMTAAQLAAAMGKAAVTSAVSGTTGAVGAAADAMTGAGADVSANAAATTPAGSVTTTTTQTTTVATKPASTRKARKHR